MARKYSKRTKKTKKLKFKKSKGGARRVKSASPRRKSRNSKHKKRNKSTGSNPSYRRGFNFAQLPRRAESRRQFMNRRRRMRSAHNMGRTLAAAADARRNPFSPPNSP